MIHTPFQDYAIALNYIKVLFFPELFSLFGSRLSVFSCYLSALSLSFSCAKYTPYQFLILPKRTSIFKHTISFWII